MTFFSAANLLISMEKEKIILDYLNSHNTIALSTVGDGLPYGATVFYLNRGFIIYFLTDPTSRHGRDMAGNPAVAATIDEDYDNWLDIKGIQIEGTARTVGTIMENGPLALAYARKFPAVKDFLLSPQKLDCTILQKITKVLFYELTPRRIYFINNAISFGHREEFLFSPGVLDYVPEKREP
ncbi:MAG: pyridoxamine 5'-phosphate oxidase family protein [Smithellaceae bacterium]|nr:pyridoxamine 5'-phosphate oxidase family protein [Smithellaceae bacterium]